MLHTLTIDDERKTCSVVSGSARRTTITTPKAAAIAILQSALGEDQAMASSGNISWVDTLASNGLAVGVDGMKQFVMRVVPPRLRTVTSTATDDAGRRANANLTMTFPTMLICMHTDRGRLVRGLMFLADASRQSTMTVASGVPVLTPFPLGNVYSGTGYICWGTVGTADIHSIQDLEDLFFGSGFNSDLFTPGIIPGNVRSLRSAPGADGIVPPPVTASYTHTIVQAIDRLLRQR